MNSGKVLGIDITIFNPKLDDGGAIAQRFVEALGDASRPRTSRLIERA